EGDVTNDGRDHAVVRTTCEFPSAANPGAYPQDILVYDIVRGQPVFVAEFNPPRPSPGDLPPRIWEADLAGFDIGRGLISVEHLAGEARCCPTMYVTRSY